VKFVVAILAMVAAGQAGCASSVSNPADDQGRDAADAGGDVTDAADNTPDSYADTIDADGDTPDSIDDAFDAVQDTFSFPDAPVATEGRIEMLIYNVAGMPMEIAELNGTNPIVNMPIIAPMLNQYRTVLVQEDFWYHADLDAGTTHPFKSDPMWETPDWDRFGDGLNTFADMPFTPVTRVGWETCNGYLDSGSDCMTTKGFTWARHQLARDVYIDVYDLHLDAGGDAADIQARQAQARQLADFIVAASEGSAVIIGGDTNLRQSRVDDMAILDELLAATGLQDSCRYLSCGDERIDRIMFRSSAALQITPLAWSVPTEFVDADGTPLSDHEPVFVQFAWQTLQQD